MTNLSGRTCGMLAIGRFKSHHLTTSGPSQPEMSGFTPAEETPAGARFQRVPYTRYTATWLKAINSGTGAEQDDMGLDGDLTLPGNPHEFTGRDAFGYVLGYYHGDYAPINGYGRFLTQVQGSNLDTAAKNLYNGNIRLAINSTKGMELQGTAYRYDVLNRLKSSRVFDNFDSTSAAWQFNNTLTKDYATNYDYDLNGNILALHRNGKDPSTSPLSSPEMDRMTYHYYPETNRLEHIDDPVDPTLYDQDIDDQNSYNYKYDNSGNLVLDQKEGLEMTWDHRGKVQRVSRLGNVPGPELSFYYDATGLRVMKELVNDSSFWYVYGADNSLMALYSYKYDNLRLEEQPLYGSSRVGVYKAGKALAPGPALPQDTVHLAFYRGKKGYELKNHLGNVMVVVSDRKLGVDEPPQDGIIDYYTADVISATDYYPFGSVMPGRTMNPTEYRYSFQGQEHDDEIKGVGNSINYAFRMHDPRLGRFLSIDPLAASFPWNSPYAFSENRVIDGIELEGLEYIGVNNPDIESTTANDDGTTTLSIGGTDYTSSGTQEFNGQQYYNVCSNLYCTPDGISTTGTNDQLITQAFVTSSELGSIFPNGTGLNNLASTLNSNLYGFGIRTPEALAHFLSQAGEETGGFANSSVTENLNYSANRLTQVWPSRFSLTATTGKALASDYANAPEKLGNFVYGNRMGNGDVASGDGYLFRGRGIFQLTGRNNYTSFQTFYNARYNPALTITTDPGPVASNANTAAISALWYFNTRVMNRLNLQNSTVEQVTRRVNGGTTGLNGRTNYYNTAIGVLK